MKKIFYFLVVAVVLTSFRVTDMSDKCWFPKGSKTQVNEDKSLSIQAPDNWVYVGYSGGKLQVASNGGITISCTCNTTGSCMPFTGSGPGGSTSGCAGDCKNCTMKQSIAKGDIYIDEGGYIDLNADVRIIEVGEEFPAAFDAMFEMPEVQKKVNDFINKVYAGYDYPEVINKDGRLEVSDGYVFAFVNICNRAAVVPIPKSAMVPNGAGGSSASCSCTNGTCKVKSKSVPFVGSVTYCEGSCNGTCTLTTSVIKDDKLEITYEAEVFKF
ncbi:MAG: hypothetical protein PHF55_00635 [Bacteroidales bacterium]|jgi:hypothetical protein|nr:hypothetical protein [Bacteroidales bacterium]